MKQYIYSLLFIFVIVTGTKVDATTVVADGPETVVFGKPAFFAIDAFLPWTQTVPFGNIGAGLSQNYELAELLGVKVFVDKNEVDFLLPLSYRLQPTRRDLTSLLLGGIPGPDWEFDWDIVFPALGTYQVDFIGRGQLYQEYLNVPGCNPCAGKGGTPYNFQFSVGMSVLVVNSVFDLTGARQLIPAPIVADLSPVPLPASVFPLIAALGGIVIAARRRKRRS